MNHDYGYDCFYAPFAVGESIVVNNSTMNFKYYAPKKNELNYYLNDLHCLDAKNIYINNSEIKFKGKKKAFTAYPSTPFGDNEISTQHIKNSKIVFRVGQCFRKGDYIYRINKINDGIITEASIHEAYWSRKKYTINKTVKAYGNKIKIVCIDKDAFKRSFKMKEVIIKSKGIKKIEKDAFARWPGVKGTIKFKVPKARKKLYSKLLKKAGTKKFVLK